MKNLSVLFVLCSTFTCAQIPLKFEEVVEVDSTLTKEVLFLRARTWFQTSFKNEKDVISIIDKEYGEISGNTSIDFHPNSEYPGWVCIQGYINFKISIYFKDGRYKFIFSNFVHEGSFNGSTPPISFGIITDSSECPTPSRGSINQTSWLEIKQLIMTKIPLIILDLKNGMQVKYELENDW